MTGKTKASKKNYLDACTYLVFNSSPFERMEKRKNLKVEQNMRPNKKRRLDLLNIKNRRNFQDFSGRNSEGVPRSFK